MTENRYGEIPRTPVIFAACDANYFKKFAPAFVESIRQNTSGKDVHIHVINPDDEVFALACYLNSRCQNKVTYTFSGSDLSQYDDQQKRALYASLRFLVLPFLLQHAQKMLILDIDCLVMEDFEFPKQDVGYFPREPLPGTQGWENEGTRVAAGCVFLSNNALNVANAISDTLGGLPLQWFNDQIALNHVFKQLPDEACHKYDGNFMDWEFNKGTTVWTGKGPRKYENQTYVKEQNKYHDRIMNYDLETYEERVILKPRLDIPFKQLGLCYAGQVDDTWRNHWNNFVTKMTKEHTHIVESPRWMFNEKIEQYFPNAEILVPHVERHNWGGGNRTKFYMQTVFPWLFTVDPLGWAGGAQYIASFDTEAEYNSSTFEMMKERLGQGKFGHLQADNTPWNKINDEYIIVPLQLPHDETIKYHSNFSVEEFVTALCEMAIDNPDMPQLVFKGHPVNLGAMQPLKEIIKGYKQLYVDNANFNELVRKAQAMFVLNGGSGQEAMLHEIPVACFGRCDYAPAVINGDIKNPYGAWEAIQNDNWFKRLALYKRWYDWYVNDVCIDVALQH